jgi:hypothetical protein
MRSALVVPLALSAAACTLLDSRDGLVGPPLAPDAGIDATSALDAAPQSGSGEHDAAATSVVTDAETDTSVGIDTLPPPVDAALVEASPDSGPVAEAIYTQLLSPLGIAVHAGTLCWVQGDSLVSIACAPATGGGASQITIRASQSDDSLVVNAFDVELDDNYLYWSNGPSNQVVRKPLSGGSSAPYFTGDQQVSYIVLDGTNLWVTDYVAGATSGNIGYGPSSTSSSMLIYPGEAQAAGVGVYSGSVYWGRASPGSVSVGPKGGSTTMIARVPTAGSVTGLAVDAAGTTYFLSGNQQVYRLAFGATMPELLYDAGTPFGDSDLAVDDTAIYWSEHDRGEIYRLPK